MGKGLPAIEEIIDRLGQGERRRGIIEASHVAQVSGMAVYRWLKAKRVRDLAPALALVTACERNAVARLALLGRLARGD